MTDSHSTKKYILSLTIFTALGLLALLLPLPVQLRILMAALYLIGLGRTVGTYLLPNEHAGWCTYLGTIYHLAMITAVGGLTYFVLDLKMPALLLVLVLSTVLSASVAAWSSHKETPPTNRPENEPKEKTDWPRAIAGAAVAVTLLLLTLYGFGLLSGAATELSVRSPWDDVPRLFFIVIFLIGTGTLSLTVGRLSGIPALLPLTALAAVITSVAVTVYSVGFGFDPFIHQATEMHIFHFGEMFPKPPYYLGQYALVTILAKLVGGQVVTIDKWLVPLGFALSLPTAYWSLRKAFGWSTQTSAAASFGLLLLPLSPFILTTPQGLADLLALLAVLTALPATVGSGTPKRLPLILAVAAAAVHPLAGVPTVLFVLLVSYLGLTVRHRHRRGLRWTFFVKLTLLMAVCLPLLFVANSSLSGHQISLEEQAAPASEAIIEAFRSPDLLSRRFSAALDFTYGWRTTRTLLLGLAGAAGLLLLWLSGRRNEKHDRQETAIAYLTGALALLSNFVLLRVWVRFPFLIDYERNNYADRLGDLTLILLAPLMLYLLGRLIQRIQKNGFPTLAVGVVLLLAATLTANVYLAYPRRDHYESSRGWSTSQADVEAVRSIERRAAGSDYAVLANQSVSAAAIRELGFKKYFNSADDEEIFFYPVPTGGSLYAVFLDLNEDLGRRQTVEQAFELTDAEEVYYVVDHYWWQAQQIVLNAKKEADDWWQEGDRVWIFRYDRKPSR